MYFHCLRSLGPSRQPLQNFTTVIIAGEKIQVYNYVKNRSDFTYIDDIVEEIVRELDKPATSNPEWSGNHPASDSSMASWIVFNISNYNPIDLMDYIETLENSLGKKANY